MLLYVVIFHHLKNATNDLYILPFGRIICATFNFPEMPLLPYHIYFTNLYEKFLVVSSNLTKDVTGHFHIVLIF